MKELMALLTPALGEVGRSLPNQQDPCQVKDLLSKPKWTASEDNSWGCTCRCMWMHAPHRCNRTYAHAHPHMHRKRTILLLIWKTKTKTHSDYVMVSVPYIISNFQCFPKDLNLMIHIFLYLKPISLFSYFSNLKTLHRLGNTVQKFGEKCSQWVYSINYMNNMYNKNDQNR